jgi:LacI family transcriptional regulator
LRDLILPTFHRHQGLQYFAEQGGIDLMRHVALIYDGKLPYDLKVMSGVAQYLQEGAEFITYTEEDALMNQKLPDLRTWHGDGIIADFDDPRVAAAVLRTKLPTVGFGGGFGWYPAKSGIPYFFSDQVKIGEMAADHLMERGLQHFAYCDYARSFTNIWSEERQRSFANRLAQYGFSCSVFRPVHKTTRQWSSVLTSLGKWLLSLPKPVGVMGANDRRAYHVLEACRTYQIQVPEQVAVLGVDNDEMLCQLSNPALSSIEQGAKQIGYQAAALLDRMMKSAKSVALRHVIAPIEVVTRKSTDVLAIEDGVSSTAMSFIRSNAHRGIGVGDVVRAVGMSRSTLETRFRTAVGHTVHDIIRRAQLDHARHLVAESGLAMKEIAANSGFQSVQHMTSLFTRAYGSPPARYRKNLIR